DLSQFTGGFVGTSTTITTGGSILASAGVLHTGEVVDGNALGNYNLFTVNSVDFPNGTFTITGTAADQVVLDVNVAANFHGVILLAGGITASDVIINMFG